MKLIIITVLLALLGLSNSVQQPAAITDSLSVSARVQHLREIYTSQLGTREASGRNDGTRVEQYLHYVGLKAGSPWCASFVCWAYGQAGIPNPRSGYCPNLFPAGKVIWTRKLKVGSGKFKVGGSQPASDIPSAGDVFGLYFSEKGRIAHVGFIDTWGDKYAVTCEGNTNEAGSREGNGVYRKRRLISSIYKVARYCQGPP